MFKLIDNFLDKKTFNTIRKEIKLMPWYYSPNTGSTTDDSNYFFYHVLFAQGKVQSEYYFNSVLLPILGKIDFKYLHGAKFNLYTKQEKQLKTEHHIDDEIPHTVYLFSFNTNNGYTEFKNGEKIKSKENTMAVFSGDLEHRSVNQTDENTRINLNINLKNVL
jgi:hypothetical protein|tara:strand:- start:69 stop:557 length:489 start_codon:yes stop_codon:yes gene_type:complete